MEVDVKLRVHLQSRIGTTLVWDLTKLDPERRSIFALRTRCNPEEAYFTPKICMPPISGPLARMMEGGDVGTIMIPHVPTGRINETIRFDVEITFGGADGLTTFLTVQPINSYTPFTKPKRILLGPDKQPVYADPVYVADISDEAAQKIANVLRGKERPPEGSSGQSG